MHAALHEDCERLERLIVNDFKQDVKGHREKLAQGHRVRKMLDQLQTQSQKLVRSASVYGATRTVPQTGEVQNRVMP